MRMLLEFETGRAALAHRRETGCGGWIFARDDGGGAVIFPWDMTPSAIFAHPMGKGDGRLIGCDESMIETAA